MPRVEILWAYTFPFQTQSLDTKKNNNNKKYTTKQTFRYRQLVAIQYDSLSRAKQCEQDNILQ